MSNFKNIRLETNSIPITRLPTHDYFQYDEFIPQGTNAKDHLPYKKKIELMHHLQNVVAASLFNPRMIYDRNKLAYCPRRMEFSGSGTAGGSFYVHLGRKEAVDPGTKGSYQIVFTLTISNAVRMSDLEDMTRNRQSSARALVATNLVQLVVRQGPNQQYSTNNGRAYFSGRPGETEVTGHGVDLWRGIFLSVRPTLGKMILTVDTCATAVFSAGPLIKVCMDMMRARNVNELALSDHAPALKKLDKFLKNVRVKVDLPGGKSRVRMIRGLVPRGGHYLFEKDEQETTVAQYFFNTYGIRLQYPNLVGVVFARENVVPIELCLVEPGQICKKIPDELRPNMVKFSAIKPDIRKKKIIDEINEYQRSEYLNESGMKLDPRLMSIPAKLLEPPKVVYGQADSFEPRGGAWNVMNRKLFTPTQLTSWAVVNYCSPQMNTSNCVTLMQALASCCSSLGMTVAQPYTVLDGHGHNPEKALDDIRRHIGNLIDEKKVRDFNLANFIIIALLPQEAASIRARVKHWGDVTHGVSTQCLRLEKFRKANNQYWNNVALKLNARLGGCNSHANSTQFMKEFTDNCGPFMIMGADVGHPGPGVQKPSVTSLVYSHDRYASQYVALTGVQRPRQEIIENFQEYAREAIMSFGAKNNIPPKSIVVFRDGVSEGEYENVAAQELEALKAAISDVWGRVKPQAPPPKVTFIIVTKRHHAVFFPGQEPHVRDRTGNCHPGIVVDSDITSPVVRDFYLQSHAAIQGTSRSSHYIVLEDQVFGGKLNLIQQLAYTLCHVYAKATRSVSIPAPVYYADLVCSRGMFHISPNDNLHFDDSSSATSAGSNSLDLDAWQTAFKAVNNVISKKMYFL